MLIGPTSLRCTNVQMKDGSFMLVPSKVIVSMLPELEINKKVGSSCLKMIILKSVSHLMIS